MREGADEQRLAEAGGALEQHVPAGDESPHHLVDDLRLADDDVTDGALEMRDCVRCLLQCHLELFRHRFLSNDAPSRCSDVFNGPHSIDVRRSFAPNAGLRLEVLPNMLSVFLGDVASFDAVHLAGTDHP